MSTHERDAERSRRAAGAAGVGDEQAGVAALLQELAPQIGAAPAPAFRHATRQRLVAMAAVRSPEPAPPSRLRRLLAARAPDAPAGRWRTRVTAGLAGAALTVTTLATLVAVSSGAQPGDVLYGLKRGTEQTQLALAGDSRGQVLLDLARNRLDELADLDGDAGLADATLAAMDDRTADGAAWFTSQALALADPAPLDRLDGWTAAQSARLTAVGGEIPVVDDVEDSLALLDAIAARADGLRTVLACPTGPAPTDLDDLGPVPAGCLPEPPAAPEQSGSQGSPEPAPGTGVPAPLPAPAPPSGAPTGPTGPTGAQPPAGPAPSQVTLPSAAPAPTAAPAAAAPGGDPLQPLQSLPPPLPAPAPLPSPGPPSGAPPAVVDVPLPLPCLGLPHLLRLGRC